MSIELNIKLPRTEPDIVAEGLNLAIRQNEPFINWTIIDKFVRSDMGLADEIDLRRAVEWAAEEIKVLALKVEKTERLAADLKVRLDDETDRPIYEALTALGWTPPGGGS